MECVIFKSRRNVSLYDRESSSQMKNISVRNLTLFQAFVLMSANSQFSYAQETDLDSLLTLDFEELVKVEAITVIGSRNRRARDVLDLPVPIDIFSVVQFNSIGNSADITDNLRSIMPSYTATPATGDGSAFVRPTSLRGMSPDQTLVLVNGKRRHRSALVHFFAPAAGNGAHGPDIGMIPDIALKSVEILRDGAAAQYGSDAIAGVINFVIRDDNEGGELLLQYGQYYDGEQSVKLSANAGFSLGDNGFLNVSLEHINNDALSRGIQRPDAQALIDEGVVGVGNDSPFDDAPFVQSWGRPEGSGTKFFLNAGVDVNDQIEWYTQGNYADTKGRYRFFYRNPEHASLITLRDLGFSGLLQGYTPYLDGDQKDKSLVSGVRGLLTSGTYYDISIGYGQNNLKYFLHNTINPSLGLIDGEPAQRDFDVGGYGQKELNLNVDISTPVSESINIAYGVEWREETYTIKTGEESSYFGSGASGLTGFRPQDSGSFKRNNLSLYADLEQDVSDEWLVQYALRYESFSGFGSTVNGKLASRYLLTDDFTIRGAISTGFHAPTPGQANIRATITTFDGVTGLQVEEGLVPATSVQAMALGGAALREENSDNYSLGFTSSLSELTMLTVDLYKIDVSDRIYRTGDIFVPETGGTISFYTNALNVETKGIDIVFKTEMAWTENISSNISFAYNYGKTNVTDQSLIGGVNPVSASTVEDIENNYPRSRFVFTSTTRITEKLGFMLRANYFGEHYDERGVINSAVNPSAKIKSSIYIDFELSYIANENLLITIGAVNIFNEYVEKIYPPNANRINVGLPYPRRSAANYEGGSWYLKGIYSF